VKGPSRGTSNADWPTFPGYLHTRQARTHVPQGPTQQREVKKALTRQEVGKVGGISLQSSQATPDQLGVLGGFVKLPALLDVLGRPENARHTLMDSLVQSESLSAKNTRYHDCIVLSPP
jgi:hypothetical protein